MPARCGDLLGSILGVKNQRELDEVEFAELLAALEKFLISTRRLHA
jgi:hypothetical protein